jgi:hypothetical protein
MSRSKEYSEPQFTDKELKDIVDLCCHVIEEWDYPNNDQYSDRVDKAQKIKSKCHDLIVLTESEKAKDKEDAATKGAKEIAKLKELVEITALMEFFRDKVTDSETDDKDHLSRLRDIFSSNKVAQLYLDDKISKETKDEIFEHLKDDERDYLND